MHVTWWTPSSFTRSFYERATGSRASRRAPSALAGTSPSRPATRRRTTTPAPLLRERECVVDGAEAVERERGRTPAGGPGAVNVPSRRKAGRGEPRSITHEPSNGRCSQPRERERARAAHQVERRRERPRAQRGSRASRASTRRGLGAGCRRVEPGRRAGDDDAQPRRWSRVVEELDRRRAGRPGRSPDSRARARDVRRRRRRARRASGRLRVKRSCLSSGYERAWTTSSARRQLDASAAVRASPE